MMTANIYRICFAEILRSDFPGLTRAEVNDCAVLAHRFGLDAATRKAEKLQARTYLRRLQMKLYLWMTSKKLHPDCLNCGKCAECREWRLHFDSWFDLQEIISPSK